MKKTFSVLFIALFLLLCLLPSAGMLIWGESGAAANEILADAPRLTTADGRFNTHVLNDASNYIADRFAFRQQFVTAWAGLNASLLHSSVDEQVLLGREGWLYYGSTLDDYTGARLPDEDLERIAQNLADIQAYVESQGRSFVFTVAPNKNSLYPGHMPGAIENRHDAANLPALLPYLRRYGVHYVDLCSLFAGGEEQYYRTDSHWTARGAAMAADELLPAMGRESSYAAGPFGSGGVHKGDLYEMLYPAARGAEEELLYLGAFSYSCQNDPRGGDAITIRTENAAADGALLCWRDSFGNALYPYLADSFGTALFSRAADYDFTRYDIRDYDAVLIEIVERNLPWLAEDCAVFPQE